MFRENKQLRQVVIAAFIINLVSGVNYCWSILGVALQDIYGWTSVQVTLPYTVFTIMVALSSVLAAKLGDLLTPRIALAIGGVVMGTGLAASGFITCPAYLVITVGIMFGFGNSILGNNTSPIAVKWAPEGIKGLVSGICYAGVGMSAVYVSPVITVLMRKYGITFTFVSVGIFSAVAVLISSMFVLTPPKLQENSTSITEDGMVVTQVSVKDALKKRSFYYLWILYIIGTISGQLISSQIARIAIVQAGWRDSASLVIALALGNSLGRLSISGISDKIGIYASFKIIYCLQIINFVLFSRYSTPVLLMIGTFITGFCFGGVIPLSTVSVSRLFGSRNLGVLIGTIQIGYGISGTVGPMLAAHLYDSTGSYTSSYTIASILLLIGVVAIILLQRERSQKA